MSELKAQMTFEDLTTPSEESERDPGHDAWARAKIEFALKEANEHPERRIPMRQVWKKFGLED